MKYIQNFHDKTEPEVLAGIGNIDYPVVIGGGNTNEGIKIFIEESRESLNTKLTNANSIEEAFDITYKPYIINGYDQRMSLTTSLGFGTRYYNAYKAGELENPPYYYNYSKVSPVTFSSTNTDVATVDSNGVVTVIASGTTNIKVNFAGNDKYKPHEASYLLTVDIPISVDPYPEYPTYNGHQYVDLGLPSGTKWATMNIGANSIVETGLYYQWGDSQGYALNDREEWGDANYKWYNAETDDYTKYCDTDKKITLDSEDDAAVVSWGNGWHMPTEEQMSELINEEYTTYEWVNNYLHRGVNGALITSKINNNTLFLPANKEIGTEWERSVYLTKDTFAGDGWSTPYCISLYASKYGPDITNETCEGETYRRDPYTVRPVC